ncbi:MAG TPA: exonuclease domain-containing protein [Solirubrobacteraceae bacterium]
MSWHTGRLAAFDIETTGVDRQSDRIVTAAVSLVGGDQPAEHLAWLVDPGIDIPSGAISVHGITTELARAEGRVAGEAVDEITTVLADQLARGVPIVAFNACFDLTILDREARRHGLRSLVDRVGGTDGMLVIDPRILDKQFDRFRRGKRTLSATCEHYRVKLDDPHAANADALAAARIAYRLGAGVPDLRDLDLRTLHRLQISWASEQAESLENYFRRAGRAEHVDGAWPVVPDDLARAA